MSIGLHLGLFAGGTVVAGGEPPIITATNTPAMSPLYDGDAMEDVTNWASFDQTSNYASTEGTIVSAVVAYTGDAVDASTALDAGDTVGFTVTVTDSEANERVFNAGSTTVAALAPAQFGTGDWSVANAASGGTVDVSVSAVPDDGGSAITDIEYQIDGGAWVSSGTTDTTGFSITGLTDGVEVDIALRAVNAAGNGTASATKAVTPTTAVTPATVDSVTAGTWTGSAQPLTVSATGAQDDDGVYWVIVPAADDAPSAAEVRAGQANGGGSPTDSGNDVWPGPFSDTLVSGIPNGSYKACVVIDNGALSNVGVSAPFTVDTTPADLGTPAVTGGTAVIDWAFTADEDSDAVTGWRVSYWPDGTDPSDAEIESGTGSTATTTGTASASVEESGQFTSVAAGTHQPTIFYKDTFGNKTHLTLADVTVTAGGAMETDTGVIYWYGYDDTTRSGTDVTAVNDKGGNAFALTSIGAFSAPQQADASSAIVFDGANPDVIQTATADAGNRLLQQHLIGGGSSRLFFVVDGASLGTSHSALFAESQNNGTNQSIFFGCNRNSGSGNIELYIAARRFSDAFGGVITTSIPAVSTGMFILEVEITQTDYEIWINGTSVRTGTVTAGNFPNASAVRATLGALASDASSANAFTGDFYEMFATGTTDGTVLGNIRAQLGTKYSITL